MDAEVKKLRGESQHLNREMQRIAGEIARNIEIHEGFKNSVTALLEMYDELKIGPASILEGIRETLKCCNENLMELVERGQENE